MMKRLMVLMVGLVLVIVAVGKGATIHVPADQPTIQAGINAAVDGDTVLVAAGLYREDTLTISSKYLTIRGSFNPDTTFFDGRMVVNNSNVVIRTVAFTHLGSLNESGGVFYGVSSDLDADSIVVQESKAIKGGALCIENGGRIVISHSNITGYVTCESPCTWGERVGGAIYVTARSFVMSECIVSGYANYEPRDGKAAGGALYLNCDTVAICGSDVSGYARAWSGGANVAEGGVIRCSAVTYRSRGNVFSGYAQADGNKVTPADYPSADSRGGALFLNVHDGYIVDDIYRQCYSSASYWTTLGHGNGAKAFGGAIYATGSGTVKISNAVFDTTFVQVSDSTDSLQIALGGAVYSDCQTTIECGIFHSVLPDYVFGAQLIPCSAPPNRVWYVSAAGSLCSEDGSAYFPLQSIQGAINVAVDGDTVIVLPGSYYEENISLMGKSVILSSRYIFDNDPSYVENTKIIDTLWYLHIYQSRNPRIICESGEGPKTVISGFSIYGSQGVRIASASPTVQSNKFMCYKRAGGGAGIYVNNGSSRITGNHFSCWLDIMGSGGAILAEHSSLYIANNSFSNCYSPEGGGAIGLQFGDSTEIRNCLFSGNRASVGMAVAAQQCSQTVIDSCRFEDHYDGTSVVDGDGLKIENCVFVNHMPQGESSALRVSDSRIESDSISGFAYGIYVNGWGGSIRNSIIEGNTIGVKLGLQSYINSSRITGSSQVGILSYLFDNTCSIESCFVDGNRGAIEVTEEGGTIRRCVLANNLDYGVRGLGETSSPLLIQNNTIWGGAIGLEIGATNIVENNAVVADSIGIVLNGDGGQRYAPLSTQYNDIWSPNPFQTCSPILGDTSLNLNVNGIPCDSFQNIFRDPLFVNSAVGDFSLQSNSPCIDAGNPDMMFYDPDGTRNDIGARFFPHWMSLKGVLVEELPTPTHIVSHSPAISWWYESLPTALHQSKCEIAVGSDSDWTYSELWNPSPFNSADTFVVYNGSPLTDGATYWLRLRVNNSLVWSDWKQISFRMNSVPCVPQLQLPLSGEIVTTQQPTLSIRNSADAENDSLEYIFEISQDSMFTTMFSFVSRQQGDSVTSIVIDSVLAEDVRYWWRVKASDYFEQSVYSPSRSFYVNSHNSPPSAFTLTSPVNTLTTSVATLLPQFIWSAASDPDPFDSVRYSLFIAVDQHFVFASEVSDLPANSFEIADSLSWGTRYWWKVKAYDPHGAATWSGQVFSFRTATLGDADGDASITIADVVFLVNYIFADGAAPQPLFTGDANCDGGINIADAVYVINYIFVDGSAPCGEF